MTIPSDIEAAALNNYADCAIDGAAASIGVPLTTPSRGMFIGVGGDVVYESLLGNSVTLKNVASGTPLPYGFKQLLTGTTATDIVAIY